jgi:hypothetical protein
VGWGGGGPSTMEMDGGLTLPATPADISIGASTSSDGIIHAPY